MMSRSVSTSIYVNTYESSEAYGVVLVDLYFQIWCIGNYAYAYVYNVPSR